MKRLTLILAALLLIGADDCEQTPGDTVVNPYCHGTPLERPTGVSNVIREYERHGVSGSINAIIGGTPATERLATVYLRMINGGSCTAGVIGPHTVLSAGHCDASQRYRICTDPLRLDTCTETTETLLHPGYYRWSYNRSMPHDDLRLLYFPDVLLPGYTLDENGNEVADENQIQDVYEHVTMAKYCKEIRAQGHGAWELREDSPYRPEGPGCEDADNDGQPDCLEFTCPDADGDGEPDSRCLLEAEYRVRDQNIATPEMDFSHPSEIKVGGVDWQWKCFGDSGSILYARVEGHPVKPDGWYMAGVTSTVNSVWCVTGGTDVHLQYYRKWINENRSVPGGAP